MRGFRVLFTEMSSGPDRSAMIVARVDSELSGLALKIYPTHYMPRLLNTMIQGIDTIPE